METEQNAESSVASSTVHITITVPRTVSEQEAEAAMYAACDLLRVNTSDESWDASDWTYDVRHDAGDGHV